MAFNDEHSQEKKSADYKRYLQETEVVDNLAEEGKKKLRTETENDYLIHMSLQAKKESDVTLATAEQKEILVQNLNAVLGKVSKAVDFIDAKIQEKLAVVIEESKNNDLTFTVEEMQDMKEDVKQFGESVQEALATVRSERCRLTAEQCDNLNAQANQMCATRSVSEFLDFGAMLMQSFVMYELISSQQTSFLESLLETVSRVQNAKTSGIIPKMFVNDAFDFMR